MKKFVIGDIYGGYKALKQCLELANFNYDNDQLIFLGDVVDGWPETPQCIEELLKIKNLIFIIGNYDMFKYSWIYKKRCASNFAQAKYAPMKEHEEIVVSKKEKLLK